MMVTRETSDGLSRQEWKFSMYLRGSIVNYYLSSYEALTRPSRRHKLRNVAGWLPSYRQERHRRLQRSEVPLPQDVVDEAKRRIIESIQWLCTEDLSG